MEGIPSLTTPPTPRVTHKDAKQVLDCKQVKDYLEEKLGKNFYLLPGNYLNYVFVNEDETPGSASVVKILNEEDADGATYLAEKLMLASMYHCQGTTVTRVKDIRKIEKFFVYEFERAYSDLGRYTPKSEVELLEIIRQLLKCMCDIHEVGVHLDVKPENVLIFLQENKVRVAMCDFAMGHVIGPYDQLPVTHVFSAHMRPPEACEVSARGKPKMFTGAELRAMDMFALGRMIMWVTMRFYCPNCRLYMPHVDSEPKMSEEMLRQYAHEFNGSYRFNLHAFVQYVTPSVASRINDVVNFCMRAEPLCRAKATDVSNLFEQDMSVEFIWKWDIAVRLIGVMFGAEGDKDLFMIMQYHTEVLKRIMLAGALQPELDWAPLVVGMFRTTTANAWAALPYVELDIGKDVLRVTLKEALETCEQVDAMRLAEALRDQETYEAVSPDNLKIMLHRAWQRFTTTPGERGETEA